VRRISVPALAYGVRGLTGCTATHCLYYSCSDRRMGCFDVETDQVVWDRQYESGCDRSCITPDGATIFAPSGWWEKPGGGGFIIVNGKTGEFIKRLPVGEKAHNSIASADGSRVYLGTDTKLSVIDAHEQKVIKEIPHVGESGVFPYTVDSRQRYAYVCLGKHVGFDVVDLEAGKAIQRVFAGEAPIAHRTHGAALTPDEKELWISDQVGKKLFIFDATQAPPTPKGSVDLSAGGHGWVNFSLDGAYAWCHTPDVFDAHTRQKIAMLKDENGKLFASSKLLEVQMRDGKVIRIGNEFGIGHATGAQ